MPGLLRRGTREAAPEGPGGCCQAAGAAGQSWRLRAAGESGPRGCRGHLRGLAGSSEVATKTSGSEFAQLWSGHGDACGTRL